jgi:protein O-GlcNAc transferase
MSEDATRNSLKLLLQEGLAHHRAGQLDQARVFYEKVLEEDASIPEALYLLGVLLAQIGDLEKALVLFDRSIDLGFEDLALHSNRAKLCTSLGRFHEAAQSFDWMIEYEPNSLDALIGWAECQEKLGAYEKAIKVYSKVLALTPDHLPALSALANLFYRSSKIWRSLDILKRSLALAPGDAALHSSYALILLEVGQIDKATKVSKVSILMDPSISQSYLISGRISQRLDSIDEALTAFDQALTLDSGSPAIDDKTCLLYDLGFVDQAVEAAQIALMKEPTSKRWSTFLACLSHHREIDEDTLFSLHQAYAQQFEAPFRLALTEHPNERSPERSLRIGFVSGDFCNHVVTTLVFPIIQRLDPHLFEVWAYSNSHEEDFVTEVIKETVHHWQRVDALDDDAFINLIQGDRIDVLIDLSGHTAKNRLPVFARKPAPIQVTWIGDPVTTGLSTMDYVITDVHLSPEGHYEQYWTEKFIRVPAAATLELTGAEEHRNLSLPALRNGYVTFGSFNRAPKINADVLQAWAAILRAVPNAKLMVCGTPSQHQAITRDALEGLGVSKDRMIFKGRTSKGEYLRLHQDIDILLDSWPYSGGGTTALSLSFGAVPIVTFEGQSMRHSQGAWFMRHLGLNDWIADSSKKYVEIAVEKASSLESLGELRKVLPDLWRQSLLGDPQAVTRGFEDSIRAVWRRYCEEGIHPKV